MTERKEYIDISTIGIDQVSPQPAPLPTSSAKATVSYWMATTSPDQLPTSLETLPSHSDVVIIGSGITGVSTAYHLINSASSSDPIASITIVEARTFCTGATGRNGGHLTAASALAYTDLAANPNHILGERAAALDTEGVKVESAKVIKDILQFESNTASAIRTLIAEEDAANEIGFTDDSNWHLCFEQAEVDAFERSLAEAGEHEGLQRFVDLVRRVPREEVDRRMDRPADVVAVYEIPGATLHPRALVSVIYRSALRIAAEKGITLQLVTDTPVLKVTPSAAGSILSTDKGDIEAQYVVHATNGYASHLLPHLSSSDSGIIPTRAQVVAVSPTHHNYLWGMGLSAGGGYEYGHQRPTSSPTGPLYILGGGREYAKGREWGVADDSSLNDQVSEFLHPYLAKHFPNSYSGKEVEMEWTAVMGYTKSKDPLVGPTRKGEWIAAGYSGHGMTRAWGCAEVVAEMVGARARGARWVKSGVFPDCYLTEGATNGDGIDEKIEGQSKEEHDSITSPAASKPAAGCCNIV